MNHYANKVNVTISIKFLADNLVDIWQLLPQKVLFV